MSTSRRRFLLASAAVCGQAATASLARSAEITVDVAKLDRRRVLQAADRYMALAPVTLTSFSSPRSAGGAHDYFSEGDYWWPDPAHPGGPYIQRDGLSNPGNFVAHRHALINLSVQQAALAAAYKITRQKKYADHAAAHLRAWFLAPETRMNPSLEYAQAIHGLFTGRGIGIIDTLHLVEVAQTIPLLAQSGALQPGETEALKDWFGTYVHWMATSEHGLAEKAAKNNHGTCWTLQAAQFAKLAGLTSLVAMCRAQLEDVNMAHQIAPDGSFPEELKRTKPYSYSIFNLDVMCTAAQVLDAWNVTLPDGRDLERAVAFMAPYLKDKSKWPYARDVEYFDDLPNRQPSLLFAGLAYQRADFIALWMTLRPDPTTEEIVRNFPIRQPVLWV